MVWSRVWLCERIFLNEIKACLALGDYIFFSSMCRYNVFSTAPLTAGGLGPTRAALGVLYGEGLSGRAQSPVTSLTMKPVQSAASSRGYLSIKHSEKHMVRSKSPLSSTEIRVRLPLDQGRLATVCTGPSPFQHILTFFFSPKNMNKHKFSIESKCFFQ